METIKLIEMIRAMAKAVIEAEPELTKLDCELGDGDCGIGMKTGFLAVLNALEGKEDCEAAEILKITAKSLISAVGGTSGAIYGTAFMRMAKQADTYVGTTPDLMQVGEILKAGLEGARMRGENTQIGDKTLIDALEPAVCAFQEEAGRGASLQEACHAATLAAKAGSDSTIDMIAKKGRASYLGERSIGHRDAGSYGIYIIAEAIERAGDRYEKDYECTGKRCK